MTAAVTPTVVGFIAILGLFCAQRHGGARLGGFVSGLPLVSLPCAMMAALTGGYEAFSLAIYGAIVATGVSAFAMMMLGRLHHHAALPVGIVVMLIVMLTICSGLARVQTTSPAAAAAFSMALLAVALVLSRVRRPVETSAISGAAARAPLALPMLCAALGSYVVTVWVFTQLGPFWAGAFSSSPILGVCAIAFGVKQGGSANVLRVTRGYASGCVCKFGILVSALLIGSLARLM